MEALWNLEDKWKLTTQKAILLFACTAFALIGLCTAAMLKRKTQRRQKEVMMMNLSQLDPSSADGSARWSEAAAGGSNNNWITIRRVLMESMRWSGREMPPAAPLLGSERCESSVGWQSHNSASPVWQRPILMGEKCELPRHSGLILYDLRGRLLDHCSVSHHHHHHAEKFNVDEEKPAATAPKTTRKDSS